jgi:hypothetical protein
MRSRQDADATGSPSRYLITRGPHFERIPQLPRA